MKRDRIQTMINVLDREEPKWESRLNPPHTDLTPIIHLAAWLFHDCEKTRTEEWQKKRPQWEAGADADEVAQMLDISKEEGENLCMSKSAAWHTVKTRYGSHFVFDEQNPDGDSRKPAFDLERWKPLYSHMCHEIEASSHDQVKKVLKEFLTSGNIDWWSAMDFGNNASISEKASKAQNASFEDYCKKT